VPSKKGKVIFYVDTPEEKDRLLREAKRFGVTMTEYLNSALKIGLPVVKRTLDKAKKEQEHVTEKTKVDLNK